MAVTAGYLKQELLKVYNVINRSIFDMGVREQSVEFINNKILLLSKSNRSPVLKELDINYPNEALQVNQLLINIFKEKLKVEFSNIFGFSIVAIFKDYDVASEYSVTLIILDCDVNTYLNDRLELNV